ncbi:NAD-dependent epimerase/dehydratase family protein [Paenibacillus thermotolerans]|uniref:NAD-dependent epimerase/dehydratase family protein n=1 Tax=Paenibacillus thermotolerans TaxID=3027807 RepID=UPI00236878FE|nr:MULTISPECIES: NAD-dependent epimerase/dehydratase family protein [unclassified Paenibacillus]
MKKVLVTGATGFVGGALTRKLVELGYEVHVFTRQSSNKWRIVDLNPYIVEHEVDLRDMEGLKRIVKIIKPEVVYHLATHGGYYFQRNTSEIIESNFMGTINLLLACQEVGFDYFVNTGSSSEYGVKNKEMAENDLLVPLGDYAVSKAAASLYCESERLQKQLPIVTLRLFSPYGPWDAPSRFIPYVIKSYLEETAPELSTPFSVRDYIYIDDVVDVYLEFLRIGRLDCGFLNIGSGKQISLGDAADVIKNTTKKNISPNWGALEQRKKEPEIWKADITLAQEKLKWNPKVAFEKGIEATVNWLNENIRYY